MGQLIVSEFVTLDGVMQARGGPEEDRAASSTAAGRRLSPTRSRAASSPGTSSEWTPCSWVARPTTSSPRAGPKPRPERSLTNSTPHPSSWPPRSRRKLEWNNSTLIQGDLSKEVARIKQKHGEVHVIGSGNLVQTLLRHDLVDRFNLLVYPLLLGTGKRLFGEGTVPAGLRLTSSQAFPRGAIHLAYERAGKPKHGDLSVKG